MEALSEHMGGKDKAYLHRVLSGDRPMPAGFFDELPHDARGLFYARQAEAHGHYVVSPAETAEDGIRALIVGVVSCLSAMKLPARASQMARAEGSHNAKTKVG